MILRYLHRSLSGTLQRLRSSPHSHPVEKGGYESLHIPASHGVDCVLPPLPKSIKQGREYMDNMNLPTLTFTKTCVINYNNNEYYLHHRSLINCIKNILSIPDISKNFALTFEKLKVIIFLMQLMLSLNIINIVYL